MCQSANGTSEVFWRDSFRMVRSILWDQQRDSRWWCAALRFATTIRNSILHSAVPESPPESCYQVYNPTTRVIVNRRYSDVVFDERSKAPDGVAPSVQFAEQLLAQMDISAASATTVPPPPDPVFARTEKNYTVADLAHVFNLEPARYLAYL